MTRILITKRKDCNIAELQQRFLWIFWRTIEECPCYETIKDFTNRHSTCNSIKFKTAKG